MAKNKNKKMLEALLKKTEGTKNIAPKKNKPRKDASIEGGTGGKAKTADVSKEINLSKGAKQRAARAAWSETVEEIKQEMFEKHSKDPSAVKMREAMKKNERMMKIKRKKK